MPGTFTAASSQCINMGVNQPLLVSCAASTMSAWVYFTTVTPSIEFSIGSVSIGAGAATQNSRIQLTLDGSARINLFGRAGDAEANEVLVGATLSAATWYHIVGVNNYASDTQQLYINGAFSSSRAATFAATTSATNARNSAVGAQDDCTSGFMNGRIHDLRVYNRALSANEITTIYNSLGNDDIVYGLQSRIIMSESNTGTLTAKDYSPTALTLTNVGVPTYVSASILMIP